MVIVWSLCPFVFEGSLTNGIMEDCTSPPPSRRFVVRQDRFKYILAHMTDLLKDLFALSTAFFDKKAPSGFRGPSQYHNG
jgi:hypothetical protein